jgi:hypothetical protein
MGEEQKKNYFKQIFNKLDLITRLFIALLFLEKNKTTTKKVLFVCYTFK